MRNIHTVLFLTLLCTHLVHSLMQISAENTVIQRIQTGNNITYYGTNVVTISGFNGESATYSIQEIINMIPSLPPGTLTEDLRLSIELQGVETEYDVLRVGFTPVITGAMTIEHKEQIYNPTLSMEQLAEIQRQIDLGNEDPVDVQPVTKRYLASEDLKRRVREIEERSSRKRSTYQELEDAQFPPLQCGQPSCQSQEIIDICTKLAFAAAMGAVHVEVTKLAYITLPPNCLNVPYLNHNFLTPCKEFFDGSTGTGTLTGCLYRVAIQSSVTAFRLDKLVKQVKAIANGLLDIDRQLLTLTETINNRITNLAGSISQQQANQEETLSSQQAALKIQAAGLYANELNTANQQNTLLLLLSEQKSRTENEGYISDTFTSVQNGQTYIYNTLQQQAIDLANQLSIDNDVKMQVMFNQLVGMISSTRDVTSQSVEELSILVIGNFQKVNENFANIAQALSDVNDALAKNQNQVQDVVQAVATLSRYLFSSGEIAASTHRAIDRIMLTYDDRVKIFSNFTGTTGMDVDVMSPLTYRRLSVAKYLFLRNATMDNQCDLIVNGQYSDEMDDIYRTTAYANWTIPVSNIKQYIRYGDYVSLFTGNGTHVTTASGCVTCPSCTPDPPGGSKICMGLTGMVASAKFQIVPRTSYVASTGSLVLGLGEGSLLKDGDAVNFRSINGPADPFLLWQRYQDIPSLASLCYADYAGFTENDPMSTIAIYNSSFIVEIVTSPNLSAVFPYVHRDDSKVRLKSVGHYELYGTYAYVQVIADKCWSLVANATDATLFTISNEETITRRSVERSEALSNSSIRTVSAIQKRQEKQRQKRNFAPFNDFGIRYPAALADANGFPDGVLLDASIPRMHLSSTPTTVLKTFGGFDGTYSPLYGFDNQAKLTGVYAKMCQPGYAAVFKLPDFVNIYFWSDRIVNTAPMGVRQEGTTYSPSISLQKSYGQNIIFPYTDINGQEVGPNSIYAASMVIPRGMKVVMQGVGYFTAGGYITSRWTWTFKGPCVYCEQDVHEYDVYGIVSAIVGDNTYTSQTASMVWEIQRDEDYYGSGYTHMIRCVDPDQYSMTTYCTTGVRNAQINLMKTGVARTGPRTLNYGYSLVTMEDPTTYSALDYFGNAYSADAIVPIALGKSVYLAETAPGGSGLYPTGTLGYGTVGVACQEQYTLGTTTFCHDPSVDYALEITNNTDTDYDPRVNMTSFVYSANFDLCFGGCDAYDTRLGCFYEGEGVCLWVYDITPGDTYGSMKCIDDLYDVPSNNQLGYCTSPDSLIPTYTASTDMTPCIGAYANGTSDYPCVVSRATQKCEFFDKTVNNMIESVIPCSLRLISVDGPGACNPGFDYNPAKDPYDYCVYQQSNDDQFPNRCSEFYGNNTNYEKCFDASTYCYFGTGAYNSANPNQDLSARFYDEYVTERDAYLLANYGIDNVVDMCDYYGTDATTCKLKGYIPSTMSRCEYLGSSCAPECSYFDGDPFGCIDAQPFSKCLYKVGSDQCVNNNLDVTSSTDCENRNCATARNKCYIYQNQGNCTTDADCTWLYSSNSTSFVPYCERQSLVAIAACRLPGGGTTPTCDVQLYTSTTDSINTVAGQCKSSGSVSSCINQVDTTLYDVAVTEQDIINSHCVAVVIGGIINLCKRPDAPEIQTYQTQYGKSQGVQIYYYSNITSPALTTTLPFYNVTLEYLEINALRPDQVGLPIHSLRSSGVYLNPDQPDELWQEPCLRQGYEAVGLTCCPPWDVIQAYDNLGNPIQQCSPTPTIPENGTSFENPLHPQNLYITTGLQLCNSVPADQPLIDPYWYTFDIYYMCRGYPDDPESAPENDLCPGFWNDTESSYTPEIKDNYNCYPFMRQDACEDMFYCTQVTSPLCLLNIEFEPGLSTTFVRLDPDVLQAFADNNQYKLYNNSIYYLDDTFNATSKFLGATDVTLANITTTFVDFVNSQIRIDMEVGTSYHGVLFGDHPEVWGATLPDGARRVKRSFETENEEVINLVVDKVTVAYHSFMENDFATVYQLANSRTTCKVNVTLYSEDLSYSQEIFVPTCFVNNPFQQDLPESDNTYFISHNDHYRRMVYSPPFNKVIVSGSLETRATGYALFLNQTSKSIDYVEFMRNNPTFSPEMLNNNLQGVGSQMKPELVNTDIHDWCGSHFLEDFNRTKVLEQALNYPVLQLYVNFTNELALNPVQYWNATANSPEFNQTFFNDVFALDVYDAWLEAGCDVPFANHLSIEDAYTTVNGTFYADKMQIFWTNLRYYMNTLMLSYEDAFSMLYTDVILPIAQTGTNGQCIGCKQNGTDSGTCSYPVIFQQVRVGQNALNGMCLLTRPYILDWYNDKRNLKMDLKSLLGTQTIVFNVPFRGLVQTIGLSDCPVVPNGVTYPQATIAQIVLINNSTIADLIITIRNVNPLCENIKQFSIGLSQPPLTVDVFLCNGFNAIQVIAYDGVTICYQSGVNFLNQTLITNSAGFDDYLSSSTITQSILNDLVNQVSTNILFDNRISTTEFGITQLDLRTLANFTSSEMQFSLINVYRGLSGDFNSYDVPGGSVSFNDALGKYIATIPSVPEIVNRTVELETFTSDLRDDVNIQQDNIANLTDDIVQEGVDRQTVDNYLQEQITNQSSAIDNAINKTQGLINDLQAPAWLNFVAKVQKLPASYVVWISVAFASFAVAGVLASLTWLSLNETNAIPKSGFSRINF